MLCLDGFENAKKKSQVISAFNVTYRIRGIYA